VHNYFFLLLLQLVLTCKFCSNLLPVELDNLDRVCILQLVATYSHFAHVCDRAVGPCVDISLLLHMKDVRACKLVCNFIHRGDLLFRVAAAFVSRSLIELPEVLDKDW